jgi:hypothetical protein
MTIRRYNVFSAKTLVLVILLVGSGSAFQVPLPAESVIVLFQKASSALTANLVVPTLPEPSPQVEAEVFSDLSHAFGEVLPLMGGPTLIFRLSILVGRAFQVASDYLSDQSVLSDDFAFEIPLLGVSSVLVWRSLAPILQAVLTTPSPLDEIVFEQLFQPVGVNWLQFRSMLATCIDWVDIEPGHVLESEDEAPALNDTVYLYWLYEGEVAGYYKGDLMWEVERHNGKSIDDPKAVGLFADMKFLYSLDLKEKKAKSLDNEVAVVRYPLATLIVGRKGATLMRIESEKMFDLMDHDEQLAASIRKLLLKSLQRKVGLLLRSKSEGSPSRLLELPQELSL